MSIPQAAIEPAQSECLICGDGDEMTKRLKGNQSSLPSASLIIVECLSEMIPHQACREALAKILVETSSSVDAASNAHFSNDHLHPNLHPIDSTKPLQELSLKLTTPIISITSADIEPSQSECLICDDQDESTKKKGSYPLPVPPLF